MILQSFIPITYPITIRNLMLFSSKLSRRTDRINDEWLYFGFRSISLDLLFDAIGSYITII